MGRSSARLGAIIASAVVLFAALAVLPVAGAGGYLLKGSDFLGEKQRVRAPELEGHRGWLNTDEPLSISGLRGKIVLLDFWTYGCVNCIHILPDLKRLEEKWAKELVVIGVHSAKFDNEKETENIRNIIVRYGIEHPVVNDADFKIWRSYAVNAWPTQVLIDPDGYVVGRVSGEGHFETIDRAIASTAQEFREKGRLDERPLDFALERAKVGRLPLAFPGKVLADESSKRLYISDTNHNRIVVSDLDGNLIETIGSGVASAKDGAYGEAGFRKPQGLALDGTVLYVADTENHAIRKVDLEKKEVETIAGTGSLEGFNGFGGDAMETSLRSPWDVVKIGDHIYIAMAGSHQIWRLHLPTNAIEPYAGTRWESRKDGPVKQANFAQPSGLATDGKRLFVADSESNIIRSIDLKAGRVETLAGGDLFDFGDVDGKGDEVRLQHPLGVVADGGKVLIADTYNHKIKTLNPVFRTVRTFLGTGGEGQNDGKKPTFYEPAGLSIAAGKLFIADTNNHAIRVADLKAREVKTLKIEGLKPPKFSSNASESDGPKATEIDVTLKSIPPGVQSVIQINLRLPDGFHLNPDAPQRLTVVVDPADLYDIEFVAKPREFPVEIHIRPKSPASATINVGFTAYYCREDNTGVCYIKNLRWRVPVNADEASGEPAVIRLEAVADRQ